MAIAILLVTGVAALLRARTAGNETSAAAALRVTNSAQFAYGAVWQAEGGVPPSEPLGPPAQPVQ